jgi:hypothetical protein
MNRKRTKLFGVTWILLTTLLTATPGWGNEAFRTPEIIPGVRTDNEILVTKKIRDDLSLRADNRWGSRYDSRDLDRIIRNAYEDILRIEPDQEDLRYYRSRMIDDDWTENDVRKDLRMSGDYHHGSRMSRHQAEQIVRDAYREVLRREPDPDARAYVDRVLYEGWTEADLIRELRNSEEYRHGGRMNRQEAERIVRDAYREVLKRGPDPGSRGWVDKVLNDHWTKQDVIRALRNSDEYKHKGTMNRQEAERIVRNAYREVLGREPDPGSRGWVDKVLNDHWSEEDVARALRDSDEYRGKHR